MNNSDREACLDPVDWTELRRSGHTMLDDMFDHFETLPTRPLWSAPSAAARASICEAVPTGPGSLDVVHAQFKEAVLPHASGNTHPGFMGWVQGGGTAVGMLAEMLAAGMNANVGGRHHMAVELERQVLEWTKRIFAFPEESSGLLLTGTSAANFNAVLVARTRALGPAARQRGLTEIGRTLTAYTSVAAHGCITRAIEMAGIGRNQLRLIPVGLDHRIDLAALQATLAHDRAAGMLPFLLIGTAGTVDTGAIDDLAALADIAAAERLHFHVDGAFGALAILAPELASRLVGLERADSLAFDWHKWGQVPYDCGCILVRDAELHRRTFAADAAYLSRAPRGLAAGDWWPCDYGPELSRSFRALKVWFTLKTYGTDAIGRVIARTVVLAAGLAEQIRREPELELLGPSDLNIVCFGYVGPDPDRVNAEIVADLHEAGQVAPSLTKLNGRVAIRAAIINHRTTENEVDLLVKSVIALGRRAQLARAA